MKKIKLTAMLLTVTLALSSLPFAMPVSADDGDIEVGTELMAGATTNATVKTVETDGYLHMYNRASQKTDGTDATSGLGFAPASGVTLKAGTPYYVSFKHRTANPTLTKAENNNNATGMVTNLVTKFKLLDIEIASKPSEQNFNGYWATPTFKIEDEAWNEIVGDSSVRETGETADATYSVSGNGWNPSVTTDWKSYEFVFVPETDQVSDSENGQLPIISLVKGSGVYRNLPVDIDDFEMWYYENGEKVVLLSCDFNKADDISFVKTSGSYNTRQGHMYFTNGNTNKLGALNGGASVAVQFDKDYYEIAAPTGNADMTFGFENLTLDSGKYVFTAEARMNFFTGSHRWDGSYLRYTYGEKGGTQYVEDNAASLTVTIGDVSKNVDITSEWGEAFTVTVDVPTGETLALSSITAAFTDDSPAANKAFDLRNVSFVKTEDYANVVIPTVEEPGNLIDGAEYKAANGEISYDSTLGVYKLVPPAGDFVSLTYDVKASDIEKGTYTVSLDVTDVKADGKVILIYAFEGDAYFRESEEFALTAGAPAELSYTFELPAGKKLTAVGVISYTEIAFDSHVLLSTAAVEEEDEDKKVPNAGIVMMMLLKKQGGSKSKTVIEKVEYIVNGDFATAPAIEKGAYDDSKGNTWFANAGDGYVKDDKGNDLKDQPIFIDHKIEWVDGYLKFSGRTNNLRNFNYNSGVTLEPGSYVFTADIKTANKGETSSIRIGIPGLFSPTTADALEIGNEWKTMRIPLTVTEPTLVRLNIWGGPNAGYKQDFCIDNVSIIGEKVTVVEAEKPAKPSVGGLLPNGGFDTAPQVVASTDLLDASKEQWIENDGTGKASKASDEPKPHDQKVEWADGVITASNRIYNLRDFWYNSGVVLEPGDYKFTIRIKAANKGESQDERIGVVNTAASLTKELYTPIPFRFGDSWIEHTETFTVTEPITFGLRFRGGYGEEYIQDFAVDYIKLEKVK